MIELSYSEIQYFLNQANLTKLADLNISILRNVMVEPIEPYLRYLAYEVGFNAKVTFGGYDNIFQEAVGGQGNLLHKDTDYVLVFARLDILSPELLRNYIALDTDRVKTETERIKEYINSVLSGIRRQTNAVILWHGFELLAYPALGIMDSQLPEGQNAMICSLNELLKDSLKIVRNAYFIDLNLCLARVGLVQFYDNRYWHIGRAPFTRQALCEIALEDFKFVRALKGKARKCLVLDCDGVLWGGIVGEDGLAGIELGQTHPGSAFYEFQQEIVNLYNRGIIIALCSKNNEEDVWEVFRKHPDMILKEEHITTYQINWRDKATNLKQIALDLNIGLESMVFIDDSEFEVNLIRETLPEVEVIHIPSDKATESRDILVSCGLFEAVTLSEEDKARGAMYKAEVARKSLLARTEDMEDYLKALGMVLEVCFAEEFTIPRIAQLTQKTNQFNLTTKRYSDDDIKAFADSNQSDVIYVKLSDRYGESGIVGVCILKYKERKTIFDTFLLSCRVLGRGVEDAFLVQALKLARKRGSNIAIGEYYATRKNKQVADFYTKRGFEASQDRVELEQQTFRYELNGEMKPEPSFFRQIVSEIDR